MKVDRDREMGRGSGFQFCQEGGKRRDSGIRRGQGQCESHVGSGGRRSRAQHACSAVGVFTVGFFLFFRYFSFRACTYNTTRDKKRTQTQTQSGL